MVMVVLVLMLLLLQGAGCCCHHHDNGTVPWPSFHQLLPNVAESLLLGQVSEQLGIAGYLNADVMPGASDEFSSMPVALHTHTHTHISVVTGEDSVQLLDNCDDVTRLTG